MTRPPDTGALASPPRPNARFITAAPYLLAGLLLFAGFWWYLPGTAFSRSPDHYRAWAFPTFRYSDIIWLYLRDGLAAHPVPYLQYPLEYPPLTGLISWIASFAPGLPAYYTAAWAANATGIMLAIWALSRIPGASPWPLAAAPALFFYPGHQFDPVAVGLTAGALAACALGRPRLGALGLTAAVSLKLFPLAFLAALCADHLRHRRWRTLAETIAIAVGVTVAINLPLAIANNRNWSFFFRWNRDRLADSGIWVLWRDWPTSQATAASMAAVVIGAAIIGLWALRTGGPLTATLGATGLLWWLFANKTFTTHLILWAFLALALLRPPRWLWLGVVAIDLAGFQIGNYLNLYNVPLYQSPALIHSAVVHLYDPLQIARSAILLACASWGLVVIRRRRMDPAWPISRPASAAHSRQVGGIDDLLPGIVATGRSRWLTIAGISCGYLAAAVIMTWPLARSLATATPPGFDPLLQIWLSRWVQHGLVISPMRLFDANIFHPFPHTLAYTDANIPGALIAWPIDLLFGNPILTSNLLTIGSFVLAGCGVCLLSIRLTGNLAAAWLAGFAYAFVPWRMVHLWHLNWLETAWMPWVLLAFLRVLESPTIRRGIVFGLAAALVTLTSFYMSVQVIVLAKVLLAAALIGDPRARNRDTFRSLAIAAGIAAAIVAPVYLPYLAVRNEQGLQRTIAEAHEYKAVPESFLSLAPWDVPNPLQRALGVRSGENRALSTVGQERHPDGHKHAEVVIEDALYPGIWTLLAAIVGVAFWRRRWLSIGLAALAVISALLSLGPTLGSGTSGMDLPYGWLFDHAPLFTAMRAPARFGGLTALALSVLAALGIAAAWSRVGEYTFARLRVAVPCATAVGLVLLASDLTALPTPLEQVDFGADERSAYAWLGSQPDGAVMEFPAESIFADPAGSSVRRHAGLAMLGSTLNWKPLVNGNSGFIPQPYSDLLERFVGNIPRPDGSLALRISHVERQTLPLLQQLGVRYLVVHRDRYRQADWPAVEHALAGAGALAPAAQFGNLLIYRMPAPLSPPARPGVALFAPTLLGPGDAWQPVLAFTDPDVMPSLLAYTRPTTLSAQWFDLEGRPVHREGWTYPVPAVTDAPSLVCRPAGCLGESVPDDLEDLLPPSTGWRPETPGHYVVQLALSGDRSLSCAIDLDVLSAAARSAGAGSEGVRWAKCTSASGVPVNDPGRPPFVVSPPSVTLAGNRVALAATITPRSAEELRGWWLLSPAGLPEPWRHAEWTSPALQRIGLASESMDFSWIEELPSTTPDGVYSLTLWFHRHAGSGWEHAAGGGFGIGPLVIERGQPRWAGPMRIGPVAHFDLVAGRTRTLAVPVSGVDPARECRLEWRMVDAMGNSVASGAGNDCAAISITTPAGANPGRFTLELRLLGKANHGWRLEDGVTMPIAVSSEGLPGIPK